MKIHWPNYRSYFSNIVEIQEDWMKKSSGFKTKYKKIDKEIMDLHNSFAKIFFNYIENIRDINTQINHKIQNR